MIFSWGELILSLFLNILLSRKGNKIFTYGDGSIGGSDED